MTFYCDTHWHVGQPYFGSCPNKWIRVIDVSLSANHSYFYAFCLFPLSCFSFITYNHFGRRLQNGNQASTTATTQQLSKNFRLPVALSTTLSALICSGIGLCTHLNSILCQVSVYPLPALLHKLTFARVQLNSQSQQNICCTLFISFK